MPAHGMRRAIILRRDGGWLSPAVSFRLLGLSSSSRCAPLRKADVAEHPRGSSAIRPEVRQKALVLIERYRDEADPERFHQAS
jgi:hypothetical protein